MVGRRFGILILCYSLTKIDEGTLLHGEGSGNALHIMFCEKILPNFCKESEMIEGFVAIILSISRDEWEEYLNLSYLDFA